MAIRERYSDDYEVIEDAKTLERSLNNTPESEEKVKYRRILHTSLFTLQKLRWQLIDSFNDSCQYLAWKSGIHGIHAFVLPQIIDVFRNASENLNMDYHEFERQCQLIQSSEHMSTKVNNFHEYASTYLLELAKVSIKLC